MAESSMLFSTTGVGDGLNSGYTQAQVTEWMRMLMAGMSGADLSGVAPDYLMELAVTGTVTPVSINTGGALVYGFPYFNTSAVTKTIATPATSTRVDLIVLQVNWAAQTVRIAVHAGTEGAGAPALTQTAGTTWEMVLAEASITTSGTITLTDRREWLNTVGDGAIGTDKLAPLAVTAAKMADGAALAEILDDDGAGSGLDADLLDGVEGSGYATAAHTHEVDERADMFSDAEGNSANVGTTADGTSTYGARRDHVHASTLDNLSDVTIAAPASSQVLTYNGSAWVNSSSPATSFNDAEGNPADVHISTSADGASTYAARRNHVHTYGLGSIQYKHMAVGQSQPTMIYTLGANQDFTSEVTADFGIVSLDYDGVNIFSNSGSGEITVSTAALIRLVASGYVGHATGSTEAWATVFMQWHNGSIWQTLDKTGRTLYVPAAQWNSFHVEHYFSFGAGQKMRTRIVRAAGSNTLRLSFDSSFIVNAIA